MKCKIFNSLWLVTEVGCGLFPTSVCGVLVFGSVSCHLSVSASRPRPQSFTRIQLCHTQSLTTLSGAVSHTILYNFVTHTISFTHNFVTRTHTQSLSHTTSSRTITHTQLCQTQLCHAQSFEDISFTFFHTSAFAWQAWHSVTSIGPVWARRALWQAWHLVTSTVACEWQAWDLVTSTSLLRGTWYLVTSTLLCAAFAWQPWHLWHWAGSGGALGRRWFDLGAAGFCVAGSTW